MVVGFSFVFCFGGRDGLSWSVYVRFTIFCIQALDRQTY